MRNVISTWLCFFQAIECFGAYQNSCLTPPIMCFPSLHHFVSKMPWISKHLGRQREWISTALKRSRFNPRKVLHYERRMKRRIKMKNNFSSQHRGGKFSKWAKRAGNSSSIPKPFTDAFEHKQFANWIFISAKRRRIPVRKLRGP